VSLVISRFEWHRVVADDSSSISRPASLPHLCSCTARTSPLSLPPSPVYRTYPFPVHVAVQPAVLIRPIPPRTPSPASFLTPGTHRTRFFPHPPRRVSAAARPCSWNSYDMWWAAGCTATYIWWGTVMVPGSPGGMRLARAGLAGQRRRSTPAFQGPTAPLLQLWIARSAHNALRPCFAPAPVLTSS